MSNTFFSFKQFAIQQNNCTQKVSTDACLFGVWVAQFIQNYKFTTALDIGAGTGLLSLILAQNNLKVTAIEIEKNCFVQLNENINYSKFHNHINTKLGNANELIINEKFDLIICNPPFFKNDLKSSTAAKNLARHDDTLSFNDLQNIITKNLSDNGLAALLYPFSRKDEIINSVSKLHIKNILNIKSFCNSEPHRFILILSKQNTETIESDFVIYDDKNIKSNDFELLMKDYYL